MIGVRGLVDVRQMAPDTGSGRIAELASNVARIAGKTHVRPGQWEFHKTVVEFCVLPVDSSVALGTIRRQSGGAVVRICCPIEVIDMAAVAGQWGAHEAASDVACVAGDAYVSPG